MVLRLDDIDDIQLKKDINQLVNEHKDAGPVIERLVAFYRAKLNAAHLDDGGDSKRRKLTQQSSDAKDDDIDDPLQQSTKIPDLSFQLPARKKYTLVFTRSKLQLMNEKTQTVEHAMPTTDIVMVACVPTPEKPAGSFTFVLFSQHTTVEPFVFTLADKGSMVMRTTNPSTSNPAQDEQILTQPEEKKSALTDLLLTTYKVITSDQLAMPSRTYYACSGVSPSTGKADTDRTFVKTHLRTKEGVLYFLPQGILFGFKKPTVFIPKSLMAATVITNVTKHTFDLGLQLLPARYPLGAGTTSWTPFSQQDDQEEKDSTTTKSDDATGTGTGTLLLPFSMIEQADYGGIERYIQKVGINDQSMTESRKAPEPAKSASQDKYENEAGSDDDDAAGDNNDETEANGHNDDDEDADVDFVPGDNSDEDNPLEYDTDADDDDDDGRHSDTMDLDDGNANDNDDDDDGIDLLDDDDEDDE